MNFEVHTVDSGVFHFGSVEYRLRERTHLMGILNVTPDSFSDGGKFIEHDLAVAHALAMINHGADFIDVGGESSRPGSDPVPEEVVLRRILPVIERLAKETSIPISVDTYNANIAHAALDSGACIVNDISGATFDDRMTRMMAQHRATAILMHMKGSPKTMQANPVYENVTSEVLGFLGRQAMKARRDGVSQIILDPGIGFGKTVAHNLKLLRDLGEFLDLGYPVLVGPSRKSFIGTLTGLPVDQRLLGTAAAVAASILRGAHIVRVHDVKEMKQVAEVSDALRNSSQPAFS